MEEAHGTQCVTASIDLSRDDATERMLSAAHGREIGLLILNAGADPNGAMFLDGAIANWDALAMRNVMTTMRALHAFAGPMKARGRGGLIVVGSGACYGGLPGIGVYAASKATLHAFARGWLNELKGRNIRVNVLHPGPIATPMQDQVLTEEAKQMFEALIPRGKMGRPEEIAAVALFLASDDSSFVNGLELSVDGGFSAI